MSTEHATDTVHETGHEAGHHESHGLSDKGYVGIALLLAFITGLEVMLTYIDAGSFFMPLLLGMMALKFLIVVSFFMHLKFDNKVFSMLFYTGLVLAIGVFCVALLTFRFFAPT
jgi:cytochrome c oxidase subunit IV